MPGRRSCARSSSTGRGHSCSPPRIRPRWSAACLAAIDVLESEPELIERLWENTRHFKAGLERLGFDTGHSETPITPVIVGAGALAHHFSDRLFEEGVFAMGIGFPTVPEEKSRVRTIVTAEHSREELDTCLEVFESRRQGARDHLAEGMVTAVLEC